MLILSLKGWELKNLECYNIDSLVGESSCVKELKRISLILCNNNVSVLLKGEKGTGKKHFARMVHFQGKNKADDFFEIYCKVYSESEFLSFISLISKLPALDGLRRTVYIGDVDSLSLELQEKLLLLLKLVKEERKNIRFIFSTEVNIEDKIEQGLFLKDLYYQISTVPVNILPLRQRKEDILPIAMYYFGKTKLETGIGFKGFSESAKEDMINHFWPGNIAELRNAVERAFIVGEIPEVKTGDMALGTGEGSSDAKTEVLETELENKTLKNAVDSFKRSYLMKILEENNWNQTKTAKILGIQRTYVIRLMNELHIRK